MSNTKRTIAALVMIAALLMVPLAMGAAPVVDDSGQTTDTTTTSSEISSGDTIAYNETTNSTLKFRADSDNYSVEILQNGTLLESFDNESAETSFVETGGTSAEKYFNLTLDDDADGYTGIVADAGENVTLTYRLINDSTMDSPDTTNVTVYWDNHANKSFMRYDGADVDVADDRPFYQTFSIPFFGANTSTDPAKANGSIGVNGDSQETVTVHVADSNAQDALDKTHSLAGDSGLSWFGSAAVGDTLVPVLTAGSDGPEWLDTSNQTYATVSDGGETLTIHNAGDQIGTDDTNVTVTAVGADALGLRNAASMMSDYGASQWTAWSSAFGAADVNGDPFESLTG